ncbi:MULTISPECIES: hypothetical protein [Paraliobacillus]|uniref:hypothetical protein n=1 Tax=Paraliobacillus TaxID=200903 RepID=UPI0013005A81|nr:MULTISPECIES: hypothetical protein [Paraliobacillus]
MHLCKMEKIHLSILFICSIIFIYSFIKTRDLINLAFMLIVVAYLVRLIINKIRRSNND